ncbi:hypothetical protein ABMY20_15325 [Tenacibaculum sp. SSH1-16]|uniref:hypothetical protein n=1 Tax=Tenacibaculum sp. SSH1-16 TaxID=3136667 RepID=UPI0032C44005
MITIHLPVKKYLKKYLISKYGDNFNVTMNSALGIIVSSVLQNKKYIYNYTLKKNKSEDVFVFNVSLRHFKDNGCHITEHHLYYINKALEDDFAQDIFMQAITNKHNFNIAYKDTIIAILQTYHIDESELSYSTIRKRFNRNKDGIMKKLKISA